MIVTVKNEVNEPEVRLRAPWNEGSRGVHRAAQEDETKYFFQAGNSSIYQRFPFRLQKDISTRQLAAEVSTIINNHSPHASICSPACIDLFSYMGARIYINKAPTARSIFEHAPVRFRLQGKQQSLTARIDLFACMHRSVRLHGSSSLYQQSPNFLARSDLFAFIGNHRLFLSTFAFNGSANGSSDRSGNFGTRSRPRPELRTSC